MDIYNYFYGLNQRSNIKVSSLLLNFMDFMKLTNPLYIKRIVPYINFAMKNIFKEHGQICIKLSGIHFVNNRIMTKARIVKILKNNFINHEIHFSDSFKNLDNDVKFRLIHQRIIISSQHNDSLCYIDCYLYKQINKPSAPSKMLSICVPTPAEFFGKFN